MVEQRWETIPVTPEHTVIAMCWKHPEQAWPIASEHLTGDSFKDTHCRVLWDAMAACVRNHEPIDVVTVGMRIPPATFRSMGGPQQVWQWVQHNTAPWIRTAFEHHLKKVVDAAKRRHCKAALEKALYVLQEAEDGCISQVQSIVADATMESIRTGLVPYQKIVADTAARLEDMARAGNPPAIPLGIRAFDERFALVPTEPDLVIIAGRPGWGKSALKQQIAEAHAKDGPTLMFELEMGAQQSALRMEAERARLAVGFERKQDVSLVHAQKLARSVGFAETLQLWMDDTPSQTIESVTAASLAHQGEGADGIVFQYWGAERIELTFQLPAGARLPLRASVISCALSAATATPTADSAALIVMSAVIAGELSLAPIHIATATVIMALVSIIFGSYWLTLAN